MILLYREKKGIKVVGITNRIQPRDMIPQRSNQSHRDNTISNSNEIRRPRHRLRLLRVAGAEICAYAVSCCDTDAERDEREERVGGCEDGLRGGGDAAHCSGGDGCDFEGPPSYIFSFLFVF